MRWASVNTALRCDQHEHRGILMINVFYSWLLRKQPGINCILFRFPYMFIQDRSYNQFILSTKRLGISSTMDFLPWRNREKGEEEYPIISFTLIDFIYPHAWNKRNPFYMFTLRLIFFVSVRSSFRGSASNQKKQPALLGFEEIPVPVVHVVMQFWTFRSRELLFC